MSPEPPSASLPWRNHDHDHEADVDRHRLRRRSRPLAAGAILLVLATACGDGAEGDAVARGEAVFERHCAACHGEAGTGTAAGPPLVHEVYEPGHHADEAFQRAVADGVAQHHWDFGPMPPVPGLSGDEVDDVIAYVRDRQREAGIID